VTGGTNQVLGWLNIAWAANSTGSVLVSGGTLMVTNDSTMLGYYGDGRMTVGDGLALLNNTYLGFKTGSVGNLTIAGGQTFVTNAAGSAVLDVLRGTLTMTGGTLTVNQLILTNSEGTVSFADGILNSGGARIDNGADFVVGNTAGGSATWKLLGGTHSLSNRLWIADAVGSTGTVVISGGKLIATNQSTWVGEDGFGQMTISNGLALLADTVVGLDDGSRGSLTVAGGTNQILGGLGIGQALTSTGYVLVTGGQLIVTNGAVTFVGNGGVGQMTVSNGLALLGWTIIGDSDGSRGSLTVAGGTNQLLGKLEVGYYANSTGSVLVTGGQFIVTNDLTFVGRDGVGQMTVSNGVARLDDTYLGRYAGSVGNLTVAGGQTYITNAAGSAVLDVLRGTLTMTGGTLTVDQLLLTNSEGTVNFAAGVLNSRGASIDNGTGFQVGKTAGGNATWNLLGGAHSLSNGLFISTTPGATGAVAVFGGQIIATNGSTAIGYADVGQMTVSNGLAQLQDTYVGMLAASRGTLSVAGGSNQILGALNMGYFANSTGRVVVSGGTLIVTNQPTYVGASGVGQMTVSNGLARLDNTYVGVNDGSLGSLTVAGGQTHVTNAAGTALLEVRRGTLTLSSGTLTTDQLLLTNSAGQVIFNSGTLNTRGTAVTNSLPFTVGNSLDPATLNLLGGNHSFTDGLIIKSNATLAGIGSVTGNLFLQDGATFTPGFSPGTLTNYGDVLLSGLTMLEFELGLPGFIGGGTNDLMAITGNLTLDGVLKVTGLSGFGTGTYTLITYSGSLTDNGLSIGLLPPGYHGSIQAGIGEVNLIVVPEPATWALLLASAGALGSRRRRVNP